MFFVLGALCPFLSPSLAAKTDIVVLHIDGREFSTLMTRVPELAAKMLPVVATRVVENSDHHSH